MTGALAACLVAIMVAARIPARDAADRMRPSRSGRAMVERPVEVVREVVACRRAPAQFVAVFQKDEQSPAF